MSRTLRRTRRTFLGSTVLVATAALALSGCASSSDAASGVDPDCKPAHDFTTIASGTLTVATYDFAPYTELKGGSVSGIEGELLKAVAKRECLSLSVLSSGGASAAIPAVQSGRADLAAGDWWRTTARAKVVSLSDPIILDQGAIVSKAGYKTVADLDGKKIGSVAGNLWNDGFQKVFGDDFTVYQDGESAFSDLAAGRVDAIIDNVASTTARFESKPVKGAEIVPLTADDRIPETDKPGQVNWPTSKKNSDLTDALNEDISALCEDGTVEKIVKKYGVNETITKVGDPYEL
ncbi:ABC transporter substrate-binding protein [Curtobacterium sp. MCSS17_005]|uniref:substrate-binding periplasmic protein n=1 Tax=Curtobacterium sp. MCSS17_005 TaxID=2175641 RepID=UPI000DA74EEF|nr:ABC transporter substrate-binding protein [Curtobacterium sp. MCSS17_005]WIB34397.1 ABC transporter substrate-binding protein [Curtobacterium sp. MCSS17_005]